jgi:hypothetical protein
VQAIARARLEVDPRDEETLFFLGKLDLNYVWLQLGTLGRKTGWDEYWEARRSLDRVLKQNPHHVRAKVARAWIDYIVDTKMPRGTRWLLGGGNKKRGLRAVREAATVEADLFVRAEASFARGTCRCGSGTSPRRVRPQPRSSRTSRAIRSSAGFSRRPRSPPRSDRPGSRSKESGFGVARTNPVPLFQE